MSDEIIVKLLRTNNLDDIKLGLNILFNKYDTEEKLSAFVKKIGKPLVKNVFYNPVIFYYISREDLVSKFYTYLVRGDIAVSIGNYGVVFLESNDTDTRSDF